MNKDWYDFMQSRPVRILLYGICTAAGVVYAISAVRDLLHPETQTVLIETIGLTGFYVLTGVRLLVMLWVAYMFGRMVYKIFKEQD